MNEKLKINLKKEFVSFSFERPYHYALKMGYNVIFSYNDSCQPQKVVKLCPADEKLRKLVAL